MIGYETFIISKERSIHIGDVYKQCFGQQCDIRMPFGYVPVCANSFLGLFIGFIGPNAKRESPQKEHILEQFRITVYQKRLNGIQRD